MKGWLKLLIFIVGVCFVFYINYVYAQLFSVERFFESTMDSIEVLLGGLFAITVATVAAIISLENRNPSRTLAWVVVLAVLPVIGFVMYIFLGQNYRKKRIYKKKRLADEQLYVQFQQTMSDEEFFETRNGNYDLIYRLAQKLSHMPISTHTRTKVLTNGENTFAKIKEALKGAKKHIHMEYYIVRHDELGKEIKDILIEKALAGVEVRFLYDAVGSFQLSKAYIKAMKQAGIRVEAFSPVYLPLLNDKVNYRNHRKIIVVDGEIGFVGGVNIGDEYLGKNAYFGLWRDTHLYVKGQAVQGLQMIFLQDWFHVKEEDLSVLDYISSIQAEEAVKGGVQIIAGGPDSEWAILKQIFFAMIASARKSLWIASPYFIPDEDILSAIKIAALSGVDVRILMPDRPDKKFVFYASRSYFPELLEAGVRIYEYKKGFLHSKVLIVDEELSSIGTANMDMRSFHLNFEVSAFLYGTESVEELMNDFQNDIKDAEEIVHGEFKKRPFKQRMIESITRLCSPLL